MPTARVKVVRSALNCTHICLWDCCEPKDKETATTDNERDISDSWLQAGNGNFTKQIFRQADIPLFLDEKRLVLYKWNTRVADSTRPACLHPWSLYLDYIEDGQYTNIHKTISSISDMLRTQNIRASQYHKN